MVIAEDLNNGNALVPIPLGGGAAGPPIVLSAPSYQLRGSSLFVWDGINNNTHVGGLLLWSAQRGGTQRISGAAMVGVAEASDDGQYIAYSSNADGTSSDLYVARWDGSSARRVLFSAEINPTCTIHLQFAGTLLFAHYCDSGDASYTLSRIDPATGSVANLANGLGPKPFSVDKNGTRVLVADVVGGAQVYDILNNKTFNIDSKVADGIMLPDGTAVLVVSRAGELKRAPVQVSPPLSFLVPNGCNVLQRSFDGQRSRPALSPDGRFIQYSSAVDAKTGLGDLFVTSTLAIDLTPLSMNKNNLIQGRRLHSDSRVAISHRAVTAAAPGAIGQLNTQSVAGGGPVMLGAASWAAYAGTGARLAWNANYQGGRNSGRADLFTGSASGGAPTAIAAQAEADFFVDSARTRVVYSITSGADAGVYAAPIQ